MVGPKHISDKTKIEIFFARGLDRPNHVDRTEEIRFYVQAVFGVVEERAVGD
jgi:hypothetical protein